MAPDDWQDRGSVALRRRAGTRGERRLGERRDKTDRRLKDGFRVPHALLVDDDSDAAETMAMLIANEGFTVATAGSLRDARRQMALQEPDIVLLDLMVDAVL